MLLRHSNGKYIFAIACNWLFHVVHQPLRWAFRLKIFKNIFENTVPQDSKNSTQYHFYVISVYCHDTVASICNASLNKC